ncbi:unnamed protein product, partial [Didymodactylos carnosus]
DDAYIQEWTKDHFDVNFPIFAKGSVVNLEGPEDDENFPEVWQFIAEKAEPPSWNFWKYIVDPNGNILHGYSPQISIRDMYPTIKEVIDKHYPSAAPKKDL